MNRLDEHLNKCSFILNGWYVSIKQSNKGHRRKNKLINRLRQQIKDMRCCYNCKNYCKCFEDKNCMSGGWVNWKLDK